MKFVRIILVLICLFFGFYHWQQRYGFDWDQADEATKVMAIIHDKKPALIGPRVASADGFFTAPYHYYFLLPFYMLAKGDPIAGLWAVITISILTVLAYFEVGRKLYDWKIGLAAAVLWLATQASFISWNAMYISLWGIIGFYWCVKLAEGKEKYFLPLVGLIMIAGVTHIASFTMLATLAAAVIIGKIAIRPKQIGLAAGLTGLIFLPLIIFDLRHQFLNSRKIIEFLGGSGQPMTDRWLFLKTFWGSLDIVGGFSGGRQIFLRAISVLIGLSFLIKADKKQRVLIIVWFLVPVAALAFYHGNIPEYYYGVAVCLLPLLLAYFLMKIKVKILGVIVIGLIVILRINLLIQQHTLVTLADKKVIVSYLVNQKTDPYFNFSYELPPGWDTGYEYLFGFYGRKPTTDSRGHLYTITTIDNPAKGERVIECGVLRLLRR